MQKYKIFQRKYLDQLASKRGISDWASILTYDPLGNLMRVTGIRSVGSFEHIEFKDGGFYKING